MTQAEKQQLIKHRLEKAEAGKEQLDAAVRHEGIDLVRRLMDLAR